MKGTIFRAINRGANDADLARICREYYFENRAPKRGKQWTKEAYAFAQDLLNTKRKLAYIVAQLNFHYEGKFTEAEINYQIEKGALVGLAFHPKSASQIIFQSKLARLLKLRLLSPDYECSLGFACGDCQVHKNVKSAPNYWKGLSHLAILLSQARRQRMNKRRENWTTELSEKIRELPTHPSRYEDGWGDYLSQLTTEAADYILETIKEPTE